MTLCRSVVWAEFRQLRSICLDPWKRKEGFYLKYNLYIACAMHNSFGSRRVLGCAKCTLSLRVSCCLGQLIWGLGFK